MLKRLSFLIAIGLVTSTIALADWENTGDAPSGSRAIATFVQWLSNYPHLELTTDAIWNGAKFNNLGTYGTGSGTVSNTITPNFCQYANAKFILSSTTATLANPACINEGQTFTLLIQQQSTSPPGGGGDLISSYGSYYKFAGGTKPTLSAIPNLWDIFQCTTLLSPGTSTLIGVCSSVINPQ